MWMDLKKKGLCTFKVDEKRAEFFYRGSGRGQSPEQMSEACIYRKLKQLVLELKRLYTADFVKKKGCLPQFLN